MNGKLELDGWIQNVVTNRQTGLRKVQMPQKVYKALSQPGWQRLKEKKGWKKGWTVHQKLA